MNSIELKNFYDNKLEIVSSEITSKIKKQIENLLFTFSNEKIEIIILKEQQQTTLKSQLTDKIESGDGFSLIKKHFPDAKIMDILLKN